MELKEVIGRRRSIRIFAPYRPVERAKVQKMLEAAKLIQRPPPLPWREAELQYLVRAVDLETRLVRLDSLAPEEE